MNYTPHTPAEFTDALRALLPPGKAWEWADGGLGAEMLAATAEELARLESSVPIVLKRAIDTHRPKYSSWHIREYQRMADEALVAAGVTEKMPRKMFAIGSTIGERLWSKDAPETDFIVPLVQVFHLFAPMSVGRRVGDGSGLDPAARLWSWAGRTRYVLLVRYYKGVAPLEIIRAALDAFRQAHVFLWFEDITGTGGNHASH
jgi:hypothetical protein